MLEAAFRLFALAFPVATISWTVTHEDLFREIREACQRRSQARSPWPIRKFFYVFTCEYCFSHYVALVVTALTDFTLVLPDWRGTFIAWLSLVWIANVYMSVYARLRLEIKAERMETETPRKRSRPRIRVEETGPH